MMKNGDRGTSGASAQTRTSIQPQFLLANSKIFRYYAANECVCICKDPVDYVLGIRYYRIHYHERRELVEGGLCYSSLETVDICNM